MNEIASAIVTYNPNIKLLMKNIYSIEKQVFKVIIIDNGSENISDIVNICKNSNNVYLIQNEKNYGIAKALNQAFAYAYENGFDWLLTLDQDSICPQNMISTMLNLVKNNNIGIIAPTIIDRNVGIIGHSTKYEDELFEVRTCITSGALTSTEAWKKVEGFDEKMFIDSVDFEFCYKLRKKKYKIFQTNLVKLDHSIGDAKFHRFLFFKFKDTEHTAFRYYYIAQNNIYYPKKHKLILHLIRGNLRNLILLFVVLIYQQNKLEKADSIIEGWINGYKL